MRDGFMKTKRRIENRNIRKITKVASGQSYSITLPIDVIRRWKWRERQKVVLTMNEEEKSITIRDWRENRLF